MLDVVGRARRGNFQIAWVSGERGIGKSSLVKMVLHLAETQQGALAAHAHLGGAYDFVGVGREVMKAVARDGDRQSWGKNLFDFLGERIQRVGIWGVDISLNVPERDLDATGRNLPREMAALLQKVGDGRAPMVIVLDDINGLAESPEFAHRIKNMTEETSRIAVPVCLILVGLEARRHSMMRHNPSVGRVFQPTLLIEPWSHDETREFFRRGFIAGGIPEHKIGSSSGINIDMCTRFSGGIPMLAQEIGHAMWHRWHTDKTGGKVATESIMDAAASIGRQHLQGDMNKLLRNEKYHGILLKILEAIPLGGNFSRTQLPTAANLSTDEKDGLDSCLRRMRKLGAMIPDENSGERGVYRFPSLLHQLYLHLVAYHQQDRHTIMALHSRITALPVAR